MNLTVDINNEAFRLELHFNEEMVLDCSSDIKRTIKSSTLICVWMLYVLTNNSLMFQ